MSPWSMSQVAWLEPALKLYGINGLLGEMMWQEYQASCQKTLLGQTSPSSPSTGHAFLWGEGRGRGAESGEMERWRDGEMEH